MSCEDQMVQTLKEFGHRPTPQRLMILSAVRHSAGHATASEILEQVKESYSYIDLSTVYRTLDMLKEMRLVSETHMGGDQHSYEWIEQVRHHHLVCQLCDKIVPARRPIRRRARLGDTGVVRVRGRCRSPGAVRGMPGVPLEGGRRPRPGGDRVLLSVGMQVHGGRF